MNTISRIKLSISFLISSSWEAGVVSIKTLSNSRVLTLALNCSQALHTENTDLAQRISNYGTSPP